MYYEKICILIVTFAFNFIIVQELYWYDVILEIEGEDLVELKSVMIFIPR